MQHGCQFFVTKNNPLVSLLLSLIVDPEPVGMRERLEVVLEGVLLAQLAGAGGLEALLQVHLPHGGLALHEVGVAAAGNVDVGRGGARHPALKRERRQNVE